MTISLIRLLPVCLSAALTLSPSTFAQEGSSSSHREFADQMYKLLDGGKYGEMYKSFHSSMKREMTQEQWVATATDVLQKTGKDHERNFKDQEKNWGAVKIRFDSRYEAGRAIDEITVAEEDGSLKVAAIWVKPTP